MIDSIKERLEDIYKDFATLIADAEKNKEWKAILNEEELRLKSEKDNIAKREDKLKRDKIAFEAEIQFVEKVKREQAAKQKVQDFEWKKITDAQSKIEELNTKTEEFKEESARLDKKREEFKDISSKIEDIEKRERALEKEKVVSAERKRVLDEQAMINTKEKERLQRLAVSMGG